MKKKIRILICAAILLAAVALLPFPQRINVTLQGEHRANSVEDSTVELTLKGWHLNFLFFTDRLYLSGTISPGEAADKASEVDVSMVRAQAAPLTKTGDVASASVWCYRSSTDQLEVWYALFTDHFTSVLLENTDTEEAFVATKNADRTLDEVYTLLSSYPT